MPDCCAARDGVDTEADRTVGQTGHLKTPDGNLSASIQEDAPDETLARGKELALQFEKDAKTKEDSPTRVWLTYSRIGTTYWDILVAGDPVVCSAKFIIHDQGWKTRRTAWCRQSDRRSNLPRSTLPGAILEAAIDILIWAGSLGVVGEGGHIHL